MKPKTPKTNAFAALVLAGAIFLVAVLPLGGVTTISGATAIFPAIAALIIGIVGYLLSMRFSHGILCTGLIGGYCVLTSWIVSVPKDPNMLFAEILLNSVLGFAVILFVRKLLLSQR